MSGKQFNPPINEFIFARYERRRQKKFQAKERDAVVKACIAVTDNFKNAYSNNQYQTASPETTKIKPSSSKEPPKNAGNSQKSQSPSLQPRLPQTEPKNISAKKWNARSAGLRLSTSVSSNSSNHWAPRSAGPQVTISAPTSPGTWSSSSARPLAPRSAGIQVTSSAPISPRAWGPSSSRFWAPRSLGPLVTTSAPTSPGTWSSSSARPLAPRSAGTQVTISAPNSPRAWGPSSARLWAPSSARPQVTISVPNSAGARGLISVTPKGSALNHAKPRVSSSAAPKVAPYSSKPRASSSAAPQVTAHISSECSSSDRPWVSIPAAPPHKPSAWEIRVFAAEEAKRTRLQRTRLLRERDSWRIAGGANGIFTRRLDFSSFNSLPKIKLNSYQIKTEDEGNHGNDDTRCFILSTLASHNRSKVQCVLCGEYMLVFDRYPLVDGTFFLSPRQHAKFCIEVKVEGRTQFLTCVCMNCLEGVSVRQCFCRFCNSRWDGSSLVLGTMYSYDIFAAMPCCTERIKCNSCFKPVLHPAQRLNYFSDYSHMVPCPHCRTLDTHFVKSLPYCFVQRIPHSQWP